jgi:hypothetical protein
MWFRPAGGITTTITTIITITMGTTTIVTDRGVMT